MTDSIKKLLTRSIEAVESEIDTVREKPSRDVLFGGRRREHHPPGVFYYVFETRNTSLRFAEEIRGELEGYDEELTLYSVEHGEREVVLEFPHNLGETIEKISLEWENDFVLRKLRGELEYLSENEEAQERIGRLFSPDPEQHAGEGEVRVLDDSSRNEAQSEALRKALSNRVLYVWGPPGTGKTSTLGFIMANYLVKGKKVLFASNTNRAVDVGLLSVLDALEAVERDHLLDRICRFGEVALDDRRLEEVHFDAQLEREEERRKGEAGELSGLLDEFLNLQKEIDNLMEHGEEVPKVLDDRIDALGEQLEEYGGAEALEEKLERMLKVSEREELEKRELVATTLAKVCTSELFHGLHFDAVVVDEASMANLPYLMVLASKSRSHIVVVGDPMQLPPIALTDEPEARDFLEEDIFTWVSGAGRAEELFDWHDRNRPLTSFFDVQYRMNRDLAEVLSSVFYEGRLKTAGAAGEEAAGSGEDEAPTVNVVDTRRYGPELRQKDEGRGFSPVNEVHMALVQKLLKRLVLKHHVPVEEIGVIVPFRSTVYDLRRELYAEGLDQVEVGTIHTFQGREKKVILFDTVMSGEWEHGRRRHYSVRPFDEEKNGLAVPRLLNVAFSRSKERLVIIADMDHIYRMYHKKYLGRLLARFLELENNRKSS
ncbi:MAG: AAA domain-containing protein [Balneolaceae bacterium]|nr:AAA domain-containing protein [Balneolaceae bacterium]